MATNLETANVKGLFNFFRLCGKLKHLKRTGWVNHNVQDPETVAGHMYRMALMSFLFTGTSGSGITSSGCGSAENAIDRERCIRMALVHDLAESIVGDITPHNGVSKDEKYRRELEAMEQIKTEVPEEVGAELHDLWKEYEEGKSAEAIIVKDLDMFDMIFQAFEYEKAQSCELQEFFDSTKERFRHPVVKKWVEELREERNSTHKNSP